MTTTPSAKAIVLGFGILFYVYFILLSSTNSDKQDGVMFRAVIEILNYLWKLIYATDLNKYKMMYDEAIF